MKLPWRRARTMIWKTVLVFGTMPLIAGCGDGEFPMRAVKGKVVCQGQPVTSGTVTFSPIDEKNAKFGKPATATVGSDGTFTLSTNEPFDGAVVGKHSVEYVPAEEEDVVPEGDAIAEGSPQEAAQSNKQRRDRAIRQWTQPVQVGEITFEVTLDGENEFTIELQAPRR